MLCVVFFNPLDTFSTKELAVLLKTTTKKAYKICVQLEKEGIVVKYGYRTKYGWEDIVYSNLRPNSLHWQMCM